MNRDLYYESMTVVICYNRIVTIVVAFPYLYICESYLYNTGHRYLCFWHVRILTHASVVVGVVEQLNEFVTSL